MNNQTNNAVSQKGKKILTLITFLALFLFAPVPAFFLFALGLFTPFILTFAMLTSSDLIILIAPHLIIYLPLIYILATWLVRNFSPKFLSGIIIGLIVLSFFPIYCGVGHGGPQCYNCYSMASQYFRSESIGYKLSRGYRELKTKLSAALSFTLKEPDPRKLDKHHRIVFPLPEPTTPGFYDCGDILPLKYDITWREENGQIGTISGMPINERYFFGEENQGPFLSNDHIWLVKVTSNKSSSLIELFHHEKGKVSEFEIPERVKYVFLNTDGPKIISLTTTELAVFDKNGAKIFNSNKYNELLMAQPSPNRNIIFRKVGYTAHLERIYYFTNINNGRDFGYYETKKQDGFSFCDDGTVVLYDYNWAKENGKPIIKSLAIIEKVPTSSWGPKY